MSGPSIPEETLALHRGLAPEAADLLARAAEDPSREWTIDFEDDDVPEWFREYDYALQSHPTFVADEKLAQVRRATTELCRVVKNVPFSVFGADPVRIADFYDLRNPAWIETILTEPNGIDGAIARGDFLDTAKGFLCVEYNLSAFLGGWQIRALESEQLESDLVVSTLEAGGRPARVIDPLTELFRYVVERALELDSYRDDTISVLLMLSDDEADMAGVERFEPVKTEYTEMVETEFPWLTGRLFVGWLRDLELRDGVYTVEGEPVHAVIEYNSEFSAPELVQAVKDRILHLYNGAAMPIIGDKRNLALLSERWREADLSEDDRELVCDHIPWSRLTDLEETEFDGQAVTFPGFLHEARERLVLKAAMGSRGEDVFIGRETEPEVWGRAVERAAGSPGWIVQEFVPSLPYWYRRPDGELGPHAVVWGLFAFGRRYGGGFLRMMPTGTGDVINSARGASEGLILDVEGT